MMRDTSRAVKVFFWDGKELMEQRMSVSDILLADYLSNDKTFMSGTYNGKLVAIKTEQIINIEEI